MKFFTNVIIHYISVTYFYLFLSAIFTYMFTFIFTCSHQIEYKPNILRKRKIGFHINVQHSQTMLTSHTYSSVNLSKKKHFTLESNPSTATPFTSLSPHVFNSSIQFPEKHGTLNVYESHPVIPSISVSTHAYSSIHLPQKWIALQQCQTPPSVSSPSSPTDPNNTHITNHDATLTPFPTPVCVPEKSSRS